MMLDLNLTEQQFGYVLAAAAAGYAIFQFPGGVFTDLTGPRKALTIIAVLWGLLTILTAVVPDDATAGVTLTLLSLLLVRFLVGAVHAPIFPLVGGAIERWFPMGGWALPNGLSSTGLTLGVAASAPLLAWMLVQYGWRTSFLVLSPLGFVIAAAWWWYARNSAAEHPSANAAEAELIDAGRPVVEAATGDQPSWLRVLKNRDVLLLMLAYFSMNYVFYMFFNWVNYYLVTVRGFDAQSAGFVTSAQWIAGAIGATAGGLLCDYLCRRSGIRRGCAWPAIGGVLASGTLMLAGSLSADATLAVTFLAGAFFCNQLTEGAFWAAAIGIGGRHAAAACGVMNTGGNTVGFVNALLVPAIAASLGWTAAMLTGSVFAVACAILWLFIRADRPIAE